MLTSWKTIPVEKRKQVLKLLTNLSSFTKSRELEAMIGATVYFILKLNFSEKETQDVCFKDV